MFMFDALALILAFATFVPLRLVARLSEKLLEDTRRSGWETGFGDQMRLAFAGGAAMRQAQLYTAYPGPAHRVTQMLRLFGVR
jgi:hypothetical protein